MNSLLLFTKGFMDKRDKKREFVFRDHEQTIELEMFSFKWGKTSQ